MSMHFCGFDWYEKFYQVYKLHYKGAKIFDAIVKELLAKGMSNASNVRSMACSLSLSLHIQLN